MKTTTITLLIFLVSFMSKAQSLEGVWDTGQENTTVEIKSVDGVYQGKVVRSDKAKAGKLMLVDITEEGDVYEGKVYSIKKEKWYDATLELNNDVLNITVSVGFLSKEVQWNKM